jgi:putative DNA primase/helicase
MSRPQQSIEIVAGLPIDRAVEIERLASLEVADYEMARRKAAKSLGIRVSILDDLRERKRRELKLDLPEGDVGQGRPLKPRDILPWPDPIVGDRISSSLSVAFQKYVRMSHAQADVCAFWVLLSWTIDKFSYAPRLCITSPTKGCGKTTLLTLLGKLCRRPLVAGSITGPGLFRVIELMHPTLLLDESEKYLQLGSEFHGALNQGHRRGQSSFRACGDDHEMREFDTFCLAAFCRNGRTPDDLEQRSIVIELQRRLPGEPLTELREDRCTDLSNLARMCLRWADDYAGDIPEVDPDMGGLINRVADNWRPLFTLADLIGSDWSNGIRDACVALLPKDDADSNDTMLLADIKASFDQKRTDRFFSEQLCDDLAAMEGRPWAEYGKSGKPITKNKLAYRLERFGIGPENVRIGAEVRRGYHRHRFEEAWQRYLTQTLQSPEDPPSETLQRYNFDETGTSNAFQTATERSGVAFQTATEKSDVAVQKREKPASNGRCSGVAVANGETPGGSSQHKCDHCQQYGETLRVAYDGAEVSLHRECMDPWKTVYDALDIRNQPFYRPEP